MKIMVKIVAWSLVIKWFIVTRLTRLYSWWKVREIDKILKREREAEDIKEKFEIAAKTNAPFLLYEPDILSFSTNEPSYSIGIVARQALLEAQAKRRDQIHREIRRAREIANARITVQEIDEILLSEINAIRIKEGRPVFNTLLEMEPEDIARVNIDAIIRERKKNRKCG
jgi:hypothetical protein